MAEQGQEVVAEGHSGPADTEGVIGTTGNDALAAHSHVEGVLDSIRQFVRDAETEEHPHASIRMALRAPEVLIEVVVQRPVPAFGVERLNRDQQFGEEAFQDWLQNRPGVAQARKGLRSDE